MPGTFGLWGDSLDHLVHLLVAFVLALPIGWHRAHEEQSAGLRTFPLVAMASCGLVQTAISVIGLSVPNNANILQGVVTGIGFISAGASSDKVISRRVTLRRPAFGQSASWARRSVMVTTTLGSF